MNLEGILVAHILTFGWCMMWLDYYEMTACYEAVRAHIIIRHDGIYGMSDGVKRIHRTGFVIISCMISVQRIPIFKVLVC